MTFLYAILILTFIIIIHELGHYTVGRLCGVGIEEFSVGFGKKLFQWKKKGILYSIRLILVGGYVRFTGEDEDSSDPRAFNNQPVWKRFLTVLAGPAMNFALAYLVAVGMLAGYGVYDVLPQVGSVIEGTPAAQAGLAAGDVIAAVDGEALTQDSAGYARMVELIGLHDPAEPLRLTVRRGEAEKEILTGLYLDETGAWKMGVYMAQARVRMPLGESLRYGGQMMFSLTRELLKSLRNLVFRGEGLNEVSGTVGIVVEVGRTLNEGFYTALYWILLISANLGLVNLLPLPALDGGRLVFLIVEGIRRKPVPRDKEGMVHLVGLAAFFILFIVLTFHDIARLIAG